MRLGLLSTRPCGRRGFFCQQRLKACIKDLLPLTFKSAVASRFEPTMLACQGIGLRLGVDRTLLLAFMLPTEGLIISQQLLK